MELRKINISWSLIHYLLLSQFYCENANLIKFKLSCSFTLESFQLICFSSCAGYLTIVSTLPNHPLSSN